jgi:hypothetical protein
VVTERVAATIGNLSTNEDFFYAIRESGAMQRIVELLDLTGQVHMQSGACRI